MSTEPLPYRVAVLCDLRDAQGRLLMLKRAKEPNKGQYSMIGGKLETADGESPAQCAQREIQEEAGIDVAIEDLRLIGMISEQAFLGAGHWLLFVYRVMVSVEVEARSIREGELEWHEADAIDGLELPQSDREVIWPLLRKHEGGFFTAHIDCRKGGLSWRVEQEPF